MSSTSVRSHVDQLRHLTPFAVPFVIFAVAWFALIAPRRDTAERARAEVGQLQPRLAQLGSFPEAPVAAPGTEAADVFRRLPQVDPMPDLLERLARLALVGTEDAGSPDQITHLLIETGEQATAGNPVSGAPRVAREDDPDPRVALFAVPLAYTRVTVSFEASYERLGRFLWDMRDLPTIVEVHSLDVEPVADGSRVEASMVLFVYRRTPQQTDAMAANWRGPA